MFYIYLISLIIFLVLYLPNRKPAKFPSGPFKFPIIGNAFVLLSGGKKVGPQVKLQMVTKNHGKLAHVKFGAMEFVVTEDYDLTKQVLASDVWIDRPYSLTFRKLSFEKEYGIIFTSGETWKELRRFALRTLRDFGFGKKISMEEFIENEFFDFSKRLDKSIEEGNNIIPISRLFTVSVLNILWGMIAGIRFSYDNKEMNDLINKIYVLSKSLAAGRNPKDAFPYLAPLLDRFEPTTMKINQQIEDLQEYLRNCLHKRRAEGNYKTDQRDFVDVFLKAIDDSKDGPDSKYFNDDSFIGTTLDLFMAGSETTANTCEFSILYSILNPKVQKEVQKEIDTVVGLSRNPTLEDKLNMPYTEATLHEIQRLGSVVPSNARICTTDTILDKYEFPKGSFILTNFYGLHRNKEIWEDPDSFNPNRFLDENRKVINANKIFPFGGGKRICMGELLARSTLFIYYANMMQKYSFSIPKNHPRPTARPENGFTLNPVPFVFHIKHRN